jgi:ribonuclease P/MRP protein subunit RPP1
MGVIILFYDFNIYEDLKLVKEAERLGYGGLALFKQRKPVSNDLRNWKQLKKECSTELYKGILIKARNPDDMKQKVKKYRKEFDVVMVQGGDQKINRAACEDLQVDIISKPYFNRRDCGLNHVIAKKAAQNEVAIELNIKHLNKTSPYLHYKVLSYFREIIKLKKKFDFPLIITSSAKSIYDLHSPLDLIALSKCFGMDQEDAMRALSETPMKIIERSKIRDKIIVDGVKRLN